MCSLTYALVAFDNECAKFEFYKDHLLSRTYIWNVMNSEHKKLFIAE